MPPKKNAKADKKREEEERKAREEAEAAELEERERLEREEKERIEREELERLRVEEEARFLKETSCINELLEQQREILEKWKLKQWESKQWENYTRCRILPNPFHEKAFNTYLSLCEESTASKADINNTLRKVQEYLQLCSEIEILLHGDGVPQPTETDSIRYTQTLPRLQRLALAQLDNTSLQYLQEAEKHVDTETYNMRVEARLKEGLVYCMWGNVVKNPRLRNFSFQDQLKFTLDIPKPLLLADVAVRVIQLPFDLLSPLSQSYSCKKSPPATSLSTLSKSMGKGSDEDTPNNQGEMVENEMPAGESVEQEEETAEADGVDTGDVKDVSDQEHTAIRDDDENGGGGGSADGGEACSGSRAGDSCAGDAVDPDDGGEELEADEINLRAFVPACGPLLFELLEMPPQPKSVNNWTFRKVVPSYLIPYQYPVEVPRPPPSASEEELAAAPPAPTPGSSAWPPITVSMQLPDQFVFSEEPQLAQWDESKHCWRTSGFKEVTCDLDEKTISFQTFYFRPLALMVDRYDNMPYLSWSLLPHALNHTLLTVEGALLKMTVEIKEHQSTLVAPTELPALEHLLNKPLSARQLAQALSSAGAGFFPALDADEYVSVTSKDHMVEQSVYQSMAMASCAVGFQWSRWNSEAERGSVVLRAVQAAISGNNVDNLEQLDWSTYIGGRVNCKVDLSEESSELSLTPSEGCETHSTLYSALECEASTQTRDSLLATSPTHIEAIKHWLTAVRMLTFS